jgi:membrane protease YdiL (CAAX protease family)
VTIFLSLCAELCTPRLSSPDAGTLFRLLLLAPLLEEWIVRAGLHEWLLRRKCAALLALLACAAAFSLLHAASGALAMAAVFGPGLALGVLYQRWRDWRWCALAHALMNGSALIFCSFL